MKSSFEKTYSNKGNPDLVGLVPSRQSRILDIGCGVGDNARMLVEEGHIVDGITISENEAVLARTIMRSVYVYDLETGLPKDLADGAYDVVLMSHVLEHICYPAALFQDVKRILCSDSMLIVGLPNIMHYKSRIQLMLGNFEYQEVGIWDFTHFRWYTVASAQKLLKDNGFSIIMCDVTGEMPFSSLFKHFLSRNLRNKIFKLLRRISKGFFGYQIVIVGKLK